MFLIFTYSSVLFMFFRDAPVSWFQTHRYVKTQAQMHQLADAPKQEPSLLKNFNERNISILIMSIGAFCSLVSYILYISIVLSQNVLQRILRINSAMQLHSFALALAGLMVYLLVEYQISFDGLNSSMFVRREMPHAFHEKVLAVSIMMMAIASITFVSAYKEIRSLLLLAQVLTVGSIIMLVYLSATSLYSTMNIDILVREDKLNDMGSCAFIMPDFNQ